MKQYLKIATAAAMLSVGSSAQAATVVDTVLSLVIDASGSIEDNEFATQIDGYEAAFLDSAIQDGILDTGDGDVGAIAVNVVQFATSATESLGFAVLDDAADITNFANEIGGLVRADDIGGRTDIAEGINLATSTITTWLDDTNNSATRAVMDVSGDGQQNESFGGETGATAVQTQRDAADAAGIIVNGLVVGGGSSLLDYYNDNVIIGTGSFAIQAPTFLDFEGAVKTKLLAEVTGTQPNQIPLPAAGWMLIAGLGGLGLMSRRQHRRKAA